MYLAVTIDVPAALAEDAAVLLHEEGANGVEIRDGEELPPPGLTGPPAGRAVVVGYFDEDADDEAVLGSVRAALEDGGVEIRAGAERLEDQDWGETWKLHFRPIRVADRLWVVPPWEDVAGPKVVIEPGMAFGTGGHATTALCLEAIAARVTAGTSVLDVGCGSGVLGIAAARLGAGRVLMIDNDPVAVGIAAENARRNEVVVEASEAPVEEVEERFDLVVANILANPLVELAPAIAARGDAVLLSGILSSQADEVAGAYLAQGLAVTEKLEREGWVLLALGRS